MPAELTREFLEEVVRRSGWCLAEVESMSLEGEGIERLGTLSFRSIEMLMYLNLANNNLSSLQGIEGLTSLVTSIFRANRLSSMREVERLIGLPNLRDLDLRLNPIMTPASTSQLSETRGRSSGGVAGDATRIPRNRVLRMLPCLLRLDGVGVAVTGHTASGATACSSALEVSRDESAGKRRAPKQIGMASAHDDVHLSVAAARKGREAAENLDTTAISGMAELQRPERSHAPKGGDWQGTCQGWQSKAPLGDDDNRGFRGCSVDDVKGCSDRECRSEEEDPGEKEINDRGSARRRSRSGDAGYNSRAPPHGRSAQVYIGASVPNLDRSLHKAAGESLRSKPLEEGKCLRTTRTDQKVCRDDGFLGQSQRNLPGTAPSSDRAGVSRRRPRPSCGEADVWCAADNDGIGDPQGHEEKLLALLTTSAQEDEQGPLIPRSPRFDDARPALPALPAPCVSTPTSSVAVGKGDDTSASRGFGGAAWEGTTFFANQDAGENPRVSQGDPSNEDGPCREVGSAPSGFGRHNSTVCAALGGECRRPDLEMVLFPQPWDPRFPDKGFPGVRVGNVEPARGSSEILRGSGNNTAALPAPSERCGGLQDPEVAAPGGSFHPLIVGEETCVAAKPARGAVDNQNARHDSPGSSTEDVGDDSLCGNAAHDCGSPLLESGIDPSSTVQELSDESGRSEGLCDDATKFKETFRAHAAPPPSPFTNHNPSGPQQGSSLSTVVPDASLERLAFHPGNPSVSTAPRPMSCSSSAVRALEAFRQSTLRLRLPHDGERAPVSTRGTRVTNAVSDSRSVHLRECEGQMYQRLPPGAAHTGGGNLSGGDSAGSTRLTTAGETVLSDRPATTMDLLDEHVGVGMTGVDLDRLAREMNITADQALQHFSATLPLMAPMEGHFGTKYPEADERATGNREQGEHGVICKACGCGGLQPGVGGGRSSSQARVTEDTGREPEGKWQAREKEFEATWMARERDFNGRWAAREREFERRRRDDAMEFVHGVKSMLLEAHEALTSANAWLMARVDALEGTCLARLERSPANRAEGRVGGPSGGEIVPVAVRGNVVPAKVEALSSAGGREDAHGPKLSDGAVVNVSRSAPTASGATRSPSESDPGTPGADRGITATIASYDAAQGIVAARGASKALDGKAAMGNGIAGNTPGAVESLGASLSAWESSHPVSSPPMTRSPP